MSPIFSVIIPTYNRAKVISRTIKSVLNQTFKKFELIIVDDGSKDNTEEVINSFKDDRIVYIKHKVNKGQNAARNTGISIVKGKYISFLDSDDEWSPIMLERQKAKYDEDSSFGSVYARTIAVDENGNNTFLAPAFELSGYVYKKVLEQGYLSAMIGISAKREAIEKIGGFDVDFNVCDDDDFCFRLSKYYKVGLIKEDLAFAHGDGSNNVTSNKNHYAMGWLKLWDKYQEDIINLCGKEILAKHYINCAKMFLLINDRIMSRKVAIISLKIKYSFIGVYIIILSYLAIITNALKLRQKIKNILKVGY